MPRRSGLISIRKPRLRISPRGVWVTRPSIRIGRQVGLNISSRGVSESIRTPYGTLNSRTGCSCPLFLLAFAAVPAAVFTLLQQRLKSQLR